jgi:hypothetical protein
MMIYARRFKVVRWNPRFTVLTVFAACGSILLNGCNSGDLVTPVGRDASSDSVNSVIDGTHLSASLLEKARSDVQGCAFYGLSRNGVVAGLSVPVKLLPFDLPAVVTESGRVPARTVRTRI